MNKVWLVARFVGGLPGESEVEVYRDEAAARAAFAVIVDELKKTPDEYETMEDEPGGFYYDTGDYWELVTVYEVPIK